MGNEILNNCYKQSSGTPFFMSVNQIKSNSHKQRKSAAENSATDSPTKKQTVETEVCLSKPGFYELIIRRCKRQPRNRTTYVFISIFFYQRIVGGI